MGGSWIRQAIDGFSRDRRGNFAMAFAGAAAMLTLVAGYALNTAQLYNVRSQLSAALDAAVTSTARDLTTGKIAPEDARTVVLSFLQANMGYKFVEADAVSLDRLSVNPITKVVSAAASVDVPIAFPVFSSGDTRRVAVDSAALYSDKKIEVAMMLDVTLSMQGQKIRDLRNAATNAVNTLLTNQSEKNPRVRVALVPYAEAVNTGRLANSSVFAEVAGGSDLPPPLDAVVQAAAGATRPDRCATERKLVDGKADHSDDGPYAERRNAAGKRYLALVNRDDRLEVCPNAELIPLTTDRQKLVDTIKDFRANGVTAGGIAAQWGYYMLSPNWSATIANAGLGEGPAGYGDKKVAKVAILMTDGQFNTAFAGVGRSGRPQLQQGQRSRANAEAICANMKRDGIEVFTIGFDLDDSEAGLQAQAVLKNCSSPDSGSSKHYFEAATGLELDKAFQEVIRNVERLAIIK